jgi:hypothetical protein
MLLSLVSYYIFIFLLLLLLLLTVMWPEELETLILSPNCTVTLLYLFTTKQILFDLISIPT